MTYFSVENLEMLDVESIENRNDNDALDETNSSQSIFWTAIKGYDAMPSAPTDAEIVSSAAYKLSLAAEKLRGGVKEKREALARFERSEVDPKISDQLSSLKKSLYVAENFCDQLILSASKLSSEYIQFVEMISEASSLVRKLTGAKRRVLAKKAY